MWAGGGPVGEGLIPLRACYGPLPGPVQTAGRAERGAIIRALQCALSLEVVVSDFLGVAREALSCVAHLEAVSCYWASIWRQALSIGAQGPQGPS